MSRSSREYYRIHENDTAELDNDPGYQEWAEQQDAEDIEAQEAEYNEKRDYWLKKTAENNEPPF